MMRYWAIALLAWVSQALAQDADWHVPELVQQAARSIEAPAPMLRRGLAQGIPHVSPALAEVLDQYTGALAAEPVAVRISLKARPGAVLRADLARLGGVLELEQNTVMYASVPADQVARLARSGKGVRVIEPQARLAAQALSQGAASAGATLPQGLLALQQRGHRGRGVRIGILDFGFAGYAEAGLSAPLAQRSFAPGVSVFSGSSHGTECARLIQQIAPEASLLLASVGDGKSAGEGQILAATQWLVSQGAQIINLSASGYLSALDGSAALDQQIAQLTRQGSTWIVAAGNLAQAHWRGRIVDANRNGWVDLGIVGQGDLLAFEVDHSGPITITLNWTPWDGTAADLDMFLYSAGTDAPSELLAQADTVQVAGAVRPVETLTQVLRPGYYLLGLRATRLASSGEVNVFVQGAARMQPFLSRGSVGSPGTAAAALTVGAATQDGLASAAFSGRGPTEDGRAKPELLASILATGFVGTSAAAPLVTGVAALLQGSEPGQSGAALRMALRKITRPAADASALWGVLAPEQVTGVRAVIK